MRGWRSSHANGPPTATSDVAANRFVAASLHQSATVIADTPGAQPQSHPAGVEPAGSPPGRPAPRQGWLAACASLLTSWSWFTAGQALDTLLPRCSRRRQAFRGLARCLGHCRRGRAHDLALAQVPSLAGDSAPRPRTCEESGHERRPNVASRTAREHGLACPRPSVLVVVHHVPEPDRDAGSVCTVHYLESFARVGARVTLLGDDFARTQPYTAWLETLGIEVVGGAWHAFDAGAWLAENGRRFDVVLVNRPEVASRLYARLRAACPAAEFWYFGVDLRYLREERRAAATGDAGAAAEARRWRAIEEHLLGAFDRILSASREEAEVIARELHRPDVVVFPGYQYAADATERDWRATADLLFVGGFGHPPNVDAVLWFSRQIMPGISRSLRGVRLRVAGSRPTRAVRGLAGEQVSVLGHVPPQLLGELYRRSRLVVVPLRYGAGVKGKVLEAFANGVPVVSTSVGFEGVDASETGLAPVDDPGAFARRVVDLYRDPAACREVARRQTELLQARFSPAAADRVFAGLFAAVRRVS